MKKSVATILFLALLLSAISCRRIISKFTEDKNLKRVGDLWSDVPRMDGMTSSEAELPVYIHLLMRTALNNLYRLNKEGEDKTPSTGDWAVFATPKSADDVKNFYSNERMTSFAKWDPSQKSTCLDGKQYGFSGVACFFMKTENKRGIGLMIVAAQDEKNKQTTVFFVRVETDETPNANKPTTSTPQPRGEIKPLNHSAPYEIEKRPMPAGLNLDELLPKQVGPYTRTLLERSDQRGVAPSPIEVDGSSVYATYKDGSKEIFIEFAVNSSAANTQATLDTAATETTNQFPTDPRFGSIGTEPSYLKVDNESGVFFAWTRGNYYFSASAKGGEADLDTFMHAFPF
ncbi:MAG TPA: hypothetical protein VLA93_15465 [Pyrinomonadaceae bacterium]|nr:hypothetical protein [Pyrinomonadaceae bacterium]